MTEYVTVVTNFIGAGGPSSVHELFCERNQIHCPFTGVFD